MIDKARINSREAAWLAQSMGFSRAVLLPVGLIQEGLSLHPAFAGCDPEKLMPGAKSVLVAATSYPGFLKWRRGCAEVSAYYFTSQNAYLALRALQKSLSDCGVLTDARQALPSKALGMLSGLGVIGKNTLLRNTKWGSRFSLHTLITDIEASAPDEVMEARPCGDCTRCIAACPTGALTENGFHAERCLRAHMMDKTIPALYRKKMQSRLLGCEICQRVCPHQPESPLAFADCPEDFSIDKLLLCDPKHIHTIGKRIGANEARPNKLRAQAAIVAGNSGNSEYIPILQRLLASENESVVEHAKWAIHNLTHDPKICKEEANRC